MKRIGISFMMAVGVLAGAPALGGSDAVAQTSTTGAVRGRIIDKASKEAVIGATVVVQGPALQGQQAEITDENGSFNIANLPPGAYTLTVFYNEAQFSRPNVIIELGKQAFVSVPIDTTVQTSEVIELEGRAPIVDQGSTKTGVTITDEYTTRIPVGRTFGAVLQSASGTQGDLYGTSFGGSTSLENTYIIEGINTTDTAYGEQSSNLPNEFIEETEVISGGYNAEFGRSTGGVINVVTKQGGNEFKGSVFGYFTPGGMVASQERIVRSGSLISSETNLDYSTDLGFELGGPIKKDKIWFHVGYNPSFRKSTLDRVTYARQDEDGDGRADRDEDSGFEIFNELGRSPMSTSSQTHFFTAKINGAVSQNHQYQISGFGNPRASDRAFYRVLGDRQSQLYAFEDGAYDAALKWTSKFADNKTQLDIVAGYHLGYSHERPYYAGGQDAKLVRYGYNRSLSDLVGFEEAQGQGAFEGCNDGTADDESPMIVNCPVPFNTPYNTNGLGFLEVRDNARTAVNAALTQRVKLAGHHTFKLGADVEFTTYDSQRSYTGGGIWTQARRSALGTGPNDPGAWDLRSFVVRDPLLDPMNPEHVAMADAPCISGLALCRHADGDGIPADTSNRNVAFYLQDSWQIRPNLTLNAGLRYENQTGYVADAQKGQLSPEGEIIPDIAFELKGQLAPRLGLIFDPTQEGRAKLFTHWGRFYETVPMDINVRAFGGEIINFNRATTRPAGAVAASCPEALNTFDPEVLDNCAIATKARQQFGGGSEYVSPGLGGQYIDELILGAEYELMADFKMGINYVYRDLGRAIEDVSTDGGNTYLITNPGESFDDAAADLEAQAEAARMAGEDDLAALYEQRADLLSRVDEFDKPIRRYNAVVVTAQQRFSKNAMLMASYTYSRSKGNFPGLFSTETGQQDPNLTSMFDLPDLMANRYGSMGLDRPHLIKVDGFYQFDFKAAGALIMGASVRGESGIPHNALAANAYYGAGESFVLERGAAGRSPFTSALDVKATYGKKIGKSNTIEAFIDVFNLFNSQDQTDADEIYTGDNVNPIVGGDLEDARHAKTIDPLFFVETNATPAVNKNFGNLSARQAPLSVRFGLRYTF
jgi:hypothetical protein